MMKNNNHYCIEMHSGLWNQMFIYAYIRALSLRNKKEFKIDISNYNTYHRPYQLEIFNIKKSYAKKSDIPFYQERNNWIKRYLKWIFKRIDPKYHYENARTKYRLKFDKKFLNIKNWYISWHFLTDKYFSDQRNLIKDDFKFIKNISKETQNIENIISNNISVSIHVRRWDFLKYPKVYPQLENTYYEKAIKIMNEKLKEPLFIIFSDDLQYIRQNFNHIKNKIIVEHNRWDNSRQDMYLMSKCNHNIIAHSTFSRWWAYLNKHNDKIVISPKKWFQDESIFTKNDINCDEWILL